jgi:group II intron reverse transcriptase maturase
MLYNVMVMGIHQYYGIATEISDDCDRIGWAVNITLKNRLKWRLKRKPKGSPLLLYGENAGRYAKSRQIRYIRDMAVYPIGLPPHYCAQHLKKGINNYTVEGRAAIHKSLSVNTEILHKLMRNPVMNRSVEYADNRISRYTAQNGKCAVTGRILEYEEIHCHHVIPRGMGGTDEYNNLVIVHKDVHKLIHSTNEVLINELKSKLKLNAEMLRKLNRYRKKVGNAEI